MTTNKMNNVRPEIGWKNITGKLIFAKQFFDTQQKIPPGFFLHLQMKDI